MAIAVISDIPGGTAEQDDAIVRQLNVENQPAAGVIARLAGPVEGGWRILSVWESPEAWETFRRDRLEPTLRQAGSAMPQVQTWPLHSVRLAPRQR